MWILAAYTPAHEPALYRTHRLGPCNIPAARQDLSNERDHLTGKKPRRERIASARW